MLRRASIAVAQTSDVVTSVARTRRSLEALDRDLQPRVRHYMLALDWSDGARYVAKIVDHVRGTIEPDLVVAWVHDDSVARRLLTDFSAEAIECDFFHVVGSSGENPIDVAARLREQLGELGAVRYHQVVLGARADGHGVRWLTDADISTGVIEAVGLGAPLHIVGDVGVWEHRS